MSTPAGRTLAAAALLAGEAAAGVWVAFLATLLAVAAIWVYRLWRHPYGPCFGCRGRRGQNAGSDQYQFGECRLCGGKGTRARAGAKMVNRKLRKGS